MSDKIRRIDFSPDEFIAGIMGKLSPAETGVYWVICSLIYSHGGEIDNDPAWIARVFVHGTTYQLVQASINTLVRMGKLYIVADEQQGGQHREQPPSKLGSNRCATEIAHAERRLSVARANGERGGRPPKEIKDIDKAGGSSGGLANPKANHQPSPSPSPSKKEMLPSGRSKNDETSEAFEELWRVYPKRLNGNPKARARRAFDKALARGATPDQIILGAVRYSHENPMPTKYIPYTAKWLNEEGWNDEPALALNGSHQANGSAAPRPSNATILVNAVVKAAARQRGDGNAAGGSERVRLSQDDSDAAGGNANGGAAPGTRDDEGPLIEGTVTSAKH
jgi:hypothetical protein